MRQAIFACLLLGSTAVRAFGQAEPDSVYSRVFSFSAMAEYSNDSSHIILGSAENRKIGAVGFQYQRRLIHGRALDFSYSAEVRPAMVVSDPAATTIVVQTSPYPITYTALQDAQVERCMTSTSSIDQPGQGGQPPLIQTATTTCSRQNTFAEGLSPFGFQMNFAPRHRLQVVFSNHEGYMFSTRTIPESGAGAFNFTFEFGAGLEWYLSNRRSVRVEYALQHLSNKDTADQNPGVDSGFVQVMWSFGR